MAELDPAALSHLYRWIDTIPLDRPKKNIARDFSDGVLMSQVIHYFFPKLVELHNYSGTNAVDQKNYNWKTLNQKVFKKMGFMISPVDIDAVVLCKKHAIERILLLIQSKIGEYQQTLASDPQQGSASPAAASYQEEQKFPSPKAAVVQADKPKKTTAAATAAGRPAGSQYPPHQQQQQPPPQQQQAPPARQPASRSPTKSKPSAAAAPASTSQSASSSVSLPNGKLHGDKDQTIVDLRETVEILQQKVAKLEQLVQLKNGKIESLQKKLAAVAPPAQ